MILSVSRRTDIPSFYMKWFINRLKTGWLLVRNPCNPAQVSRVPLNPAEVRCIAFWSKNPEPLAACLESLRPYCFFLQFTLNPYDREMEPGLPEIARRLETFRLLADAIGRERVIWRYSPIILSQRYSAGFHIDTFGRLAEALSGFTEECKLSFLDVYPKIATRMRALHVTSKNSVQYALARQLAALAHANGIRASSCGDPHLESAGITASSCIDPQLIARLTGLPVVRKKDRGQREACRCTESVDVGTYQTCLNGCAYCYANHSHTAALRRAQKYDPESPLLCDSVKPGDTIRERRQRLRSRSTVRTDGSPLLPGL